MWVMLLAPASRRSSCWLIPPWLLHGLRGKPKGRWTGSNGREEGPAGEGGSVVGLPEMECNLPHAPANFRFGIWSQKKWHGMREALLCFL